MASYSVVVLCVVCLWATDIVQVRGKCDLVSINEDFYFCASEHRTIRKTHISGKDLIEVFDRFCSVRDLIHECVIDRANKKGCLQSESSIGALNEEYDDSEFYCTGNHVKQAISDVYKDLPEVYADPKANECMKMATHRREFCSTEIALALLISGRHSIHEKRKGLVDSMLCTYKGFGQEGCHLAEGLVMTTVVYEEMIVPPLLGVNVTATIMQMVHYYKQHDIDNKV